MSAKRSLARRASFEMRSGIRHSLTEEHGPVEDSLTVAPRSSLHESLDGPDAAVSVRVAAQQEARVQTPRWESASCTFVTQMSNTMSGPACEPSQVALSLRDRERDRVTRLCSGQA